MKALRLNAWKSDPVLEDVPVPEPGPGEVLVQVGGAGACHSDLHLMHEFEAGILPVGAAVHPRPRERRLGAHPRRRGQRLRGRRAGGRGRCVGLRLAASAAWPGSRRTATGPTWRPCPAAAAGSASTAGWPSTCWCPAPGTSSRCPDGLDPVHAAPLTDAGLTPYHAVRRSREKLGPDLHRRGDRGRRPRPPGRAGPARPPPAARIIAVDPRDSARDLASAAAPTWCWRPARTPRPRSARRRRGRGADVVLDFVGLGRDPRARGRRAAAARAT